MEHAITAALADSDSDDEPGAPAAAAALRANLALQAQLKAALRRVAPVVNATARARHAALDRLLAVARPDAPAPAAPWAPGEDDALRRAVAAQACARPRDVDWACAARALAARSAGTCFRRWDDLKPWAAWTAAEDARLARAAAAHRGARWDATAAAVSSEGRRTPLECLRRCRERRGKKDRGWTAPEDARLRGLVAVHGALDRGERWRRVADALAGRTPKQCRLRWTEHVRWHPRAGAWAPAEETKLVRAVRAHAPARRVTAQAAGVGAMPFVVPAGDHRLGFWSAVAVRVQRRTPGQCREKWAHLLDPDVSRRPWSDADDAALVAAVARHGAGRWTRIQADVPHRTDRHCRQRAEAKWHLGGTGWAGPRTKNAAPAPNEHLGALLAAVARADDDDEVLADAPPVAPRA